MTVAIISTEEFHWLTSSLMISFHQQYDLIWSLLLTAQDYTDPLHHKLTLLSEANDAPLILLFLWAYGPDCSIGY